MGICFGTLSKVGSSLKVDSPHHPPYIRSDIYADLETYLFESYGWADELQQTFVSKFLSLAFELSTEKSSLNLKS